MKLVRCVAALTGSAICSLKTSIIVGRVISDGEGDDSREGKEKEQKKRKTNKGKDYLAKTEDRSE